LTAKSDFCLGAFSIYDIDDDGYITTEEMLNVVKAIFQRRGLKTGQSDVVESKVEEIFSRMDVVSGCYFERWQTLRLCLI